MNAEMGPEARRSTRSRGPVAAVDEIDGQPHLVLADVTRDGAWIAVASSAAVALDDWE